jgi:putative modified peptide
MSNAFSPEVADALLDKLSTDDEFRGLFEKDPAAALATIGHRAPAKKQGLAAGTESVDPAMCCSLKNGKLADKATIQASREKLRAFLTRPLPQSMFGFCAN